MPQHMLQFSYTADAWAALVKNPVDRSEALGAMSKKLGAKLVTLHYSMGEHDGVAMVDAPDDATAAAIVFGAIAPGHLRSTKTTRLLTPAEIIGALKKAQGAGYKAPEG
jgi:uncharacterized protein with GYD domain